MDTLPGWKPDNYGHDNDQHIYAFAYDLGGVVLQRIQTADTIVKLLSLGTR